MKQKIGVVVARFQTNYLHPEQKKFLQAVAANNDRLIIFLGVTQTRLTLKNPLPFESRKQMVEKEIEFMHIKGEVLALHDQKSNEVWVKNLDAEIERHLTLEITDDPDIQYDVCLYGSRDSFLEVYTGSHRTEYYQSPFPEVSATLVRKGIHTYVKDNADWREGVIYASAHRFPVSFQAVDIAPINKDNEVLLGRKPGRTKFQFVGGFVDPSDESLEFAARRECREECDINFETDEYKYIGSFRIDDWRYRTEGDKIMTAFFKCKYLWGAFRATDDIEELKWFSIQELSKDHSLVEPEHEILLKELLGQEEWKGGFSLS